MGILSNLASAGSMISGAGQEMAMSNLSTSLGERVAMNNAKNSFGLNMTQAMAKFEEMAGDAAKATASSSGG